MIYLVLIIALGIRMFGLNQSLWLDEAISANVAKMPVNQIVSNFSVNDFHPPVFYWFLNFWVKFFGSSVMAMRLSSIFFSLITIFITYKIGKELKNKTTGLWAAWLTGINPLMMYYSQELRMYSMSVMWLILSVYYWIKIIVKNSDLKINWFWFNIFTFLAFTTFYGSAFLIGAMILYFLIKKEWKNFWRSILGMIIAISTVAPLLFQQLEKSKQMLEVIGNWNLVLGKVNLKNLLLIPLKFSVGRVSWYPKIIYYAISGLWSTGVWLMVIKNAKNQKLLAWLVTIPLLSGVLFSLKSPMVQYFRFLYLIPILCLILAKEKNNLLKGILTVGFLGFSLFYVLNPNMHREDWKSLVSSIGNGGKVDMIGSFADPIKFYDKTILVRDITITEPTESKVLLIPYGETIFGIKTREKMKSFGYRLERENSFRGITIQEWQQ